MNDDLTPDDPFGERLAARMHGAADPLEGTGVTRRGVVAAAVERRRRQVRNRGLAVGVAACVAVLGGLALLGRSTDDGTQHLASGPTTTRSTVCRAATASTAAASHTSASGSHWAMRSIPGLPGAATTADTSGSALRPRTRACSRAPDPMTRTFTPQP